MQGTLAVMMKPLQCKSQEFLSGGTFNLPKGAKRLIYVEACGGAAGAAAVPVQQRQAQAAGAGAAVPSITGVGFICRQIVKP